MTGRVIVVGGGYAGTMIAKELDRDADVTLIDPRDAFVNVSSSMRAMVRGDWADRPFFPLAGLLEHGRIVRGLVTSVDPGGVVLESGDRIEGEHIVLATGSSHPYPARPRSISADAAVAAAALRQSGEQLAQARHALILGAGPVGLELAGEIREAWPATRITVVAPSAEVLPGYLPEVRADLRRQLDDLGIDLRLRTSLLAPPPVPDGVHAPFTVRTSSGEEISADIWFRTFGARLHTAYLEDGALTALTERGAVPVDAHLNVVGFDHVSAVGDIADLADAKMATWAQTQAPVVVENVRARLHGEPATAEYRSSAAARILLPLGTRHGVGQLPTPDGGVTAAPLDAVIARKGADLFTSRFAERFGVVPV
ncbi:NAD(P)/FAD-dependent oxidoreductase [Amnibacterium setariae]|uniref:FAD-dependent oxidoreductase n=1 Tax=Amnibacterium setariae TaxID=2306585 RepID=A0A3A1U157_9MICO|nr:FAD-dependent oxidoreductase [Amnibacterium setariae]RIX30251.1 FAD-dependent oxidoreductase [Amnibacterium setariae]